MSFFSQLFCLIILIFLKGKQKKTRECLEMLAFTGFSMKNLLPDYVNKQDKVFNPLAPRQAIATGLLCLA